MNKAMQTLQTLIMSKESALYVLRIEFEAANDANDVQGQLTIAQEISKLTIEINILKKVEIEWSR